MFYNLFKCLIIGRIGSVETINAGTDNAFHKLGIACNGFTVDKPTGERSDMTEWVEVIVPGKTNMEYFTKGRSVLVEGVPGVNAYNDKAGKAVGKLRIVGAKVTFQDARPTDADATETPMVPYEEG